MSDAWAHTTARLIAIMEGRPDFTEGLLPEGPGSAGVLERYARTLAAASGQDLSLVLPLVVIGLSGCTHGGIEVLTRLADGLWLRTPLVLQALLMARSGVGKTTLITEVKPVLNTAFRRAGAVQAAWVETQRQAAAPALSAVGVTDATRDAWENIYASGICWHTLITSGATPEGVRDRLVDRGGHQMVLTGEPDILVEVGAYRKDAGSVTFFLNGFDQDDIDVARARKGGGEASLSFPSVTLPMAVFLQPEVFTAVTRDRQFADRGFLHRTWLVSSLHDPLRPAFEITDVDAHKVAAMEEATAAYRDACVAVSERGCTYRSAKAVRKAWEDKMMSAGGLGGLSVAPEPGVVLPSRLTLADEAAEAAYTRLQNMHSAVFNEIRLIEDRLPGTEDIFRPLAARITSHTLRWAALTALAAEPGRADLPAAAIEDAAVRVLPWLWGHWALVMGIRDAEITEVEVAEAIIRNPKWEELGLSGAVMKALTKLSNGHVLSGESVGPWFTRADVLRRARSAVPRNGRAAGLYRHLSKALDDLVAEGAMVESEDALTAAGEKGAKVRLTALGLTTMSVA